MGAGSRVHGRYVLRYCNWHKESGGLKAEQTKKQKDLARER